MTNNLTISVPEMAKMLGISKPTAYQLSRQAGFPSFLVGGRILIYAAGLEEWVRQQAQTSPTEAYKHVDR